MYCTYRGKTFLSLFHAFQDTLLKYANVLAQKYPSTHVFSGYNRIPPGEEITICHVIDTCEYCADTVEALQDLMQDKIQIQANIDMTKEQEAFYDVTARGLRVLVSGLEQRVESAFRTEMSSRNWANLDTVGEESSYVRSLHAIIQPFVETIQSVLPSSYFKNFCDKFASQFIALYYNTILRLKKISELGTQQLLLDVYNVKTLLLKMPTQTKSNEAIIPPALYTKMVTKEIAKVEIFLKLIGTPYDQLQEMFLSLWPDGTASDLTNVMNLKGLKRQEQQSLFDKMNLPDTTTPAVVVAENLQLLRENSSYVAEKVNSDLSNMRQKVDDFRRQFR